jgi:AcrR family transcriptional regulator
VRRATARERILRATVSTLAQEGYASTTARAIARSGGFAPGVIYYHFKDLDDLFLETMRYTSEERLDRYRHETEGVTSAVELLRRLKTLYDEDTAGGHIAAVQELIAASSTQLKEQIRDEVQRWQGLAEEVIAALVDGTPFASLVPTRQVAEAAVAFYLGLEMLMHLDGDRGRPEAFFASVQQAATMLDALRQPR